MIEQVFGNFLMKFDNVQIEDSRVSSRNIAIVMIATKPYFWTPLVIKNTLDKIKDCSFYFFGSIETIQNVKECIDFEINYIDITVYNLRSIEDYNKLLTDSKFWEHFIEEHILIIQPDCIILRDIKDDDLKYDYIGAICGSFNEKDFIMNGGLSMRKKDTMIEICNNLEHYEKNGSIPEDVIYTQKIRFRNNYKCPKIEDCLNFSIESIGILNKVLGIHGTDKYYIHPRIKDDFKTYFLK